jgi:predicted CXXCH cytochrome family protein
MEPKIKYTFIVVLFSLISIFSACSYKTMSFFFDGVPAPNDPLIIASNYTSNPTEIVHINEIKAVEARPEINYHMPYLDKACTACHSEKSLGKFVLPQPALCYQCHVDFGTIYTVLHVPVEVGECTSCHSPHMSEEAGLLLQTSRQLCLSCHDKGDVVKQESHDGIGDADCTECHNPHGGNESNLLN